MTHASQIVNQLEYVEETAEGTFPTNPTMVFLANVAKWSPKFTQDKDQYRRHGSEDPYKYVFGRQVFESTLEFAISSSTFIKYGISAVGGGAGSIDKALSIGFSFMLSGTKNYVTMTRSRIKSIKLDGGSTKPSIMVTVTLTHDAISTPSVTDYIGSGSHATADTTALWSMADGGANPVTWNASPIPAEEISVTISRETGDKWILGSKKMAFSGPSFQRDIKGDITVEYVASTLETDAKANTARTLAWVLKASTCTITFTNAYLTDLTDRSFDADAKAGIPEKWGFVATTVSIT